MAKTKEMNDYINDEVMVRVELSVVEGMDKVMALPTWPSSRKQVATMLIARQLEQMKLSGEIK